MSEKITSGAKNVNISIAQYDYKVIPFSIKRNGQNIKLDDDDEIVMTVGKIDSDNEKYIFQKTLENGITFNSDTIKYDIEIYSEDTKNMALGQSYGYDIVIIYGKTRPSQKVIGNFQIGKKYTKFSMNVIEEVESNGD